MAENPNDWKPATKLIRGGLMRSGHGETAEALYLTQSFVYDSAAADQLGRGFPVVRIFGHGLAPSEGRHE